MILFFYLSQMYTLQTDGGKREERESLDFFFERKDI